MLALDPNETFEAFLESDAAKPAASRPTFVFRCATARADREMKRFARDENLRAMGGEEAEQALFDAIRGRLAGMRNVPPGELEDLLTLREAWELFFKAANGGFPTEADAKNSESPPSSGAAESVNDAQAAPAQSA